MLWCTAEVSPALRARKLVQQWEPYLHQIKEHWREYLRRWILLDAAEQPDPELLELSAGELDFDWEDDETLDEVCE